MASTASYCWPHDGLGNRLEIGTFSNETIWLIIIVIILALLISYILENIVKKNGLSAANKSELRDPVKQKNET